jgi:hypothetical protein
MGIALPLFNDIEQDQEIIREKLNKDEEKEFTNFNDLLNSFAVAPDDEEQRKIRKLYIRLATQLHPDKAVNQKEADYFHGIMQSINLAYEKHDYDELLKIESQNIIYQSIENQDNSDSENTFIENLQKEIDILIKQKELVKNQNQRIKKEIAELMNHDVGKAYKYYQNNKKNTGFSIEKQIESIEKMHEMELLVIEELEILLKTGKCNFEWLNSKFESTMTSRFEQ